MITYSVIDAETGYSETIKVPRQGQDAGDKDVYKALTGSYKYALMKTFLIPTGDDPENDSRPSKKTNNYNSNKVASFNNKKKKSLISEGQKKYLKNKLLPAYAKKKNTTVDEILKKVKIDNLDTLAIDRTSKLITTLETALNIKKEEKDA